MSIRENIENNFKQSIKDRKSEITNTLRLVKSAIKDKDIAARTSGNNDGISDQEILGLLQNLIKQRKDSIESFKAAERKDLIEKEEIEIKVMQHEKTFKYLDGKNPKKVIIVPKRIVNIVI